MQRGGSNNDKFSITWFNYIVDDKGDVINNNNKYYQEFV